MTAEVTDEEIADFKTFVDNMVVDRFYCLPDSCRYRDMRISMANGEYYWEVACGHNKTGRSGNVYPMKNNGYVKQFKSIGGVKRSLYNYFKDIMFFKKQEEK